MRLLYGARFPLLRRLASCLVGASSACCSGALAEFAGGSAEQLLMRLADIVLCFPPIILAMAIAAALGIGAVNTIIAMLVVWWPKFARLARASHGAALQDMSKPPHRRLSPGAS